MLNLPNVTLIAVETQCHELCRLTLADAVSKVNFGGVVIYTDKPELIPIPDARYIIVPNWPDKVKQGQFYYQEAAQAAETSHALLMEWDAGIRDVSCWQDDFLQYDMIGAAWGVVRQDATGRVLPDAVTGWVRPDQEPEYLVGNGGFMLVSKKLADAIYLHRRDVHISTDVHLGRQRRKFFENAVGAKWAPEEVARKFSYEHPGSTGIRRQNAPPSFGYHDVFNWPLALNRDEVLHRTKLIQNNLYIRKTTKLRALCQDWPWVAQELGIKFPVLPRPPTTLPPRIRRMPYQGRFARGQRA